jgi:hypothetical protein
MATALLSFLILLVAICVAAGVVLWALQRFMPEAYPPGRLIVGGVALIAVLYGLVRLVGALGPALP